VARLCAAYPGVFELPVGGCGHPYNNFSRCHQVQKRTQKRVDQLFLTFIN
jgi:hypothetical protein